MLLSLYRSSGKSIAQFFYITHTGKEVIGKRKVRIDETGREYIIIDKERIYFDELQKRKDEM